MDRKTKAKDLLPDPVAKMDQNTKAKGPMSGPDQICQDRARIVRENECNKRVGDDLPLTSNSIRKVQMSMVDRKVVEI